MILLHSGFRDLAGVITKISDRNFGHHGSVWKLQRCKFTIDCNQDWLRATHVVVTQWNLLSNACTKYRRQRWRELAHVFPESRDNLHRNEAQLRFRIDTVSLFLIAAFGQPRKKPHTASFRIRQAVLWSFLFICPTGFHRWSLPTLYSCLSWQGTSIDDVGSRANCVRSLQDKTARD
jgi:hypothetical protein